MKTMMNETANEISTTNYRGNNKMTKFKKIFKNEKGLTLIELLAVIVILAIVAAIAVPAIGGIIENSRIKAVKADAANIINAANLYFVEKNSDATATFTQDDTEGFLENKGKFTDFSVVNSNPDELTGTVTTSGITIDFADATLESIKVESAEATATVEITP